MFFLANICVCLCNTSTVLQALLSCLTICCYLMIIALLVQPKKTFYSNRCLQDNAEVLPWRAVIFQTDLSIENILLNDFTFFPDKLPFCLIYWYVVFVVRLWKNLLDIRKLYGSTLCLRFDLARIQLVLAFSNIEHGPPLPGMLRNIFL